MEKFKLKINISLNIKRPMRNSIKIGLVCLSLLAVNFLSAQVTRQNQWSGVPCTDCSTPTHGSTEKGGSNTVQNGNGTIATSYTVSQCGLGFTTASVRLNRRSFSFTPAQGVLQPATMTISGIPPCRTIVKAFLYVGGSGNGVAITASIVNPALATNAYPMTLIGSHLDKCWGYSGTHNYRADVTSCITGNGNYVLSGIPCLGAQPNDMDGATLIIIYSDPSQTFTGHMVIGDGCREVSGGTITNTLTGFSVCGAANSTQNFVIVSDLQRIANTGINLNSGVVNYTYPLASQNVWDYIQQPGAPATAGQTTAVYGFNNASDCYNFVAAGMYYRTACQVCSSPALTITPVTTSSCSAGSATANVVGGTGPYTYTWSPTGGNAQSVSSVPTGNYTVTVADATGCNVGTATIAINAASGPTITATNNASVCTGGSANLVANGALTYTWSPSATLNTASGPNVIATPLATQVYSISGTNAAGCISTITTSVLVNTIPVVTVNNPGTCVNQTINLTSTGGGTYSWTGPMAFTSALQNPSIPSAVTGMSGAYTVLVTSAAGCTMSAVSNVTVFPLPNPNITSNSPVCDGATLNLFGTGGATYSWSGPGYVGTAQNPVINNVTAVANGVYTLLVSSGTCTASTTFTVVVNPVPVFSFAGSNVLCNGQSNGTSTVNVTVGTGPFTYQWTTSPIQTSQVASNIPAGTYSCTVTDANNCSTIGSTQITEPTQFSVAISSATLSACANTPITINAIGSGGTGPYSYNWVSGPATGVYSVNEALSGNYMYVVNAVDAFNCPATSNINLTFFPLPNVNATSATICSGQTTSLVATGATSYIWQPGNITGATYPFSGSTSINVSVIGTANGCSNTATTTVNVNPNPTANINTGTANGCVPTCVQFNAENSSAGIASYNWILNGAGITGSVNGAYCFDEAASYTLGLTLMDGNGCTTTVTPVTITVYAPPIADFNHAPIKPIVNQDPFVTFTDASYNATIVSWNWYFMNTAQYTSIEQNPIFSYTEPGTYPVVLVVKSDKGCIDTLVRPLVVMEDFGIYTPNAFTPNGDGLNDIFQPKGFGVVDYELNIFDRWGEKVFSTKKFEEGWDGTMQSKKDVKYGIMEDGTYTWLINCTSVFGKSHELKGHITLIK
jgi:gliding motility-associated-like protein